MEGSSLLLPIPLPLCYTDGVGINNLKTGQFKDFIYRSRKFSMFPGILKTKSNLKNRKPLSNRGNF